MKMTHFFKRSRKMLAIMVALGLTCGIAYNNDACAASRAEIAQISVKANGSNFKYWNKKSEAKQKLIEYVKDVTDKGSKNYIPVEERIAAFDMDGTIIGETTPYYFEYMLFLDRVFNDPTYQAPQYIVNDALKVKQAIRDKNVTRDLDTIETKDKITVLSGLNDSQFRKVVQHAMNQPVPGMTNITYGEEVYLPMAEVLSYLKANDFTIYIVSGGHRHIVRAFADGVIPVAPNHIIGSDCILKATNQGNKSGAEYVFNKDTDDIITADQELEKDDGATKAAKIYREVGMKPVLSFGNSMGDASMHQYTQSNKKYKTISFEILCDDTEREYGNLDKAAKVRKACESYGWVPVSMHDDWSTIYGDNVKKVQN